MRLKFVIGSILLAILMIAVPNTLHAQVHVGVAIGVAPPPLLVYDQPLCPGDGYFWTPGYWDYDYDASDYFWVPGTWVEPPDAGLLWTPGYWGWGGSGFLWNAGYWGPTVGFYGGINYGFGWFGTGFYGGRWQGGHFFYNTNVWHVGGGFHNVYNERVDIHNDVRVSYNGHGGVEARATSQEEAAAHERHVGPVAAQTQFRESARNDPQQRFSNNHGRPATVATARASDFHANGAERGNEARPAENGARNETNARTENGGARTYNHPNDLPAAERPAAPNTGNAKQDKKYQQQQDKLYSNQQQERQKLQSQQDKEHQQAQKQQANQQKQEQMEQRHAQQTQQLQQRHTQQTQALQQRQAPPASHASGGGGRPK